MPGGAGFQTIPSSSSAMERLKPWRSLSFRERRTWRRSLRDWAWGRSSSMVSLAMGIFGYLLYSCFYATWIFMIRCGLDGFLGGRRFWVNWMGMASAF